MCDIDLDGLMKCMVNGAIHRRPARVYVVGGGLPGAAVMWHATPELRDGEVLLETIGDRMPTIIRARASA